MTKTTTLPQQNNDPQAVIDTTVVLKPGAVSVAADTMEEDASTEHADAESTLVFFRKIRCRSQEEADVCSAWLVRLREHEKNRESARKVWTGPLHKAWKEALDLFRPEKELISQADTLLVEKLAAWKKLQAEWERKKLEQAAKKGRRAIQRVIAEKPASTTPGLNTAEKWEITTVDITKVPELFTKPVVDEEAVMDAIERGTRKIPGLLLTKEYTFRRKVRNRRQKG